MTGKQPINFKKWEEPVAHRTRTREGSNLQNNTAISIMAQLPRLEPYNGTANITRFIQDFERYMKLGAVTDDKKADFLIAHLSKQVKDHAWTLGLCEVGVTYEKLKTDLVKEYSKSDLEKCHMKQKLIGTHQTKDETVKQFIQPWG